MVLLFVLVPVILAIGPTFLGMFLPNKYMQLGCDILIILFASLFDHYFWHIKFKWFNFNRPFNQILQALPAIVFLLLTTQFTQLSIKLLTIVTVIIIAVAEELVYRGFLFNLLYGVTKGNVFITILISSIGFALAHSVNLIHMSSSIVFLQIILVFANGVLWGTVYLNTNNLGIPIMLHFLSDLPVLASNQSSTALELNNSQIQIMYMIVSVITLIICIISYVQAKFFRPKNR